MSRSPAPHTPDSSSAPPESTPPASPPPPLPESWIPPADPVQALREITAHGRYSRIRYRGGPSGAGPQAGEGMRVIEPRQLVHTASGLTVRAWQIEPEEGARSFAVRSITWVEPDARLIPTEMLARNTFASGDGVAIEFKPTFHLHAAPAASPPREMAAPAPAPQSPASAWAMPWFSKYISILRDAVVDLSVSPDDQQRVRAAQAELGLDQCRIRAAHCFVMAEELLALSIDGRIDDHEEQRLIALARCMRELGWGPRC